MQFFHNKHQTSDGNVVHLQMLYEKKAKVLLPSKKAKKKERNL